MKKNTMMRVASVLLVAVLLSTCAISGTFAKYVTEVSSNDSARIAKWGFNTASINFENLFESSYNLVSAGSDDMAIIAPGTSGEVAFMFENSLDGAHPEVAYTFTVSTVGSDCDDEILKNPNITWALAKTAEKANAQYGTWEALLTAIENLDGNEAYYDAGETPAMIDTEYTILWKWNFDNQGDGNTDNDANTNNDTELGNLAAAGDLTVKLMVTITATQINEVPNQNP